VEPGKYWAICSHISTGISIIMCYHLRVSYAQREGLALRTVEFMVGVGGLF
jgi:hypothetical protein